MALVPAVAFLNEVVAEWRESHGGTFEERRAVDADAAIVAEPVPLQAIWNLLDNAAEDSSIGVRLTAASTDGTLVIAISNNSTGFSRSQLARIGRQHHSTKTERHCVGLFLASNVARCLGGRPEATNLSGGGTEVRLILSLVA